MTKAGQTSDYKALEFIHDLKKYIGREPDYVIAHEGTIPRSILDWYRSHDELPVENNLHTNGFKGTILKDDVINRSHIEKTSSDALTRSILRHDTEKLATLLVKIIQK